MIKYQIALIQNYANVSVLQSEDLGSSLSGSTRKPDSNGCHIEVTWSCRAKKGRGLSTESVSRSQANGVAKEQGEERGWDIPHDQSSVSMSKTWIQSQHKEVSKEIIIRTVGDRQVSLT